MRKVITVWLIAICFVMLSSVSYADLDITLKQGVVYTWNANEVNNLTTFTVAKTKPIDSFGKWNILWEGWSIDAGFAYDADSFNTVGLLLGRELGVIGKYLPIDFPLKDKLEITIYPIGILVQEPFDGFETKTCSGGAIVKFNVKF